MFYKEKLKNAHNILEIQHAYEREWQRRFLSLKKLFPDNYKRMLILEHLTIWIIAEKYAISLFRNSDRYWILQK